MRASVRDSRRALAAGALALALLRPAPLLAQGPVLLEAAASRHARATDPLSGGLAITSYRGPLGLRLGGAVHLRRDAGDWEEALVEQCGTAGCTTELVRRRVRAPGPTGYEVTDWTADADFLLEPFRPVGIAKSLLLGFSPYAFVGLGGRGMVFRDAPDSSIATASWGAGVHHQLLGWLGVGAEARYRRSLRSDSAVTIGSPHHMEYRVALGVSFGGGRRGRMTSEGALARATPGAVCAGDCAPRAVERRVFAERTAARVLDAADALIGRPWDDADFVRHVFAAEHVELPDDLRGLARAGAEVSTGIGSLRPGDLLFFSGDRTLVDHVAIFVGGTRIVHATGGRVRYDVLGEGARGIWLAEHLVLARRVITGDETRLRRRWGR